MPVQFFGQYLLTHKIITREQLLEAVAYQESQNLKLGEYAVKRGYISEEQAERVNRLQQTKDLRFGDAAQELELLAATQVDELVTIQRNNHVYLGDAIVHQKLADSKAIEKALKEFQKEQERYKLDNQKLEELKEHGLCIDMTQKLLLRIWDVGSKIAETERKSDELDLPGRVVEIRLSGQGLIHLVIAAPESIITQGVKKILGEDNPDGETLDDVLREFANVVAGNVIALLAKQGKSYDISPPLTLHNKLELQEKHAHLTSIVTPNNETVWVTTYS